MVLRARNREARLGGGEHRRGIRVRWTVEKNDRYRLLELPDDLFEALSRGCRRATTAGSTRRCSPT